MPTNLGGLTAEEIKNGWTPQSLAAYHAEREEAAAFRDGQGNTYELVAGNTVTDYVRPKPPIVMETAIRSNPHGWRR